MAHPPASSGPTTRPTKAIRTGGPTLHDRRGFAWRRQDNAHRVSQGTGERRRVVARPRRQAAAGFEPRPELLTLA